MFSWLFKMLTVLLTLCRSVVISINSSTKTIHFNTSKALDIAYPYLHQLFNFAPAHICCRGKGYMLDDLPSILQKYRTYTTKYRNKTNIL